MPNKSNAAFYITSLKNLLIFSWLIIYSLRTSLVSFTAIKYNFKVRSSLVFPVVYLKNSGDCMIECLS